jgi:hypothetical protein
MIGIVLSSTSTSCIHKSQKGKIWAHSTSIPLTFLFNRSVGIKPGKWAVIYIYELWVSMLPFLRFFYNILELFQQQGRIQGAHPLRAPPLKLKSWIRPWTVWYICAVHFIPDRRVSLWYCFDNYFTYFVPVFKYCYSDSRNLWTVMRAGGLAP